MMRDYVKWVCWFLLRHNLAKRSDILKTNLVVYVRVCVVIHVNVFNLLPLIYLPFPIIGGFSHILAKRKCLLSGHHLRFTFHT